MEVTVKMNAQEALAAVEKGTLASLIKSAESELEEKPARPETPTPRPEPDAQAASASDNHDTTDANFAAG